jgi:hypothetical protein
MCLLFAAPAGSQSVEEIKKNKSYYWGEGVGKNAALADREALSMLISSISVNIESKFSVQSQQVSKGGKSDLKEYVNSLVNTHSNATVKNTEILSWGEEPEVHVFRFVKKTEVYRIFAERENKVKAFVEEAVRAESKYQAADALRYYYWALMLLKSLPASESVGMTIAGREEKLDVYLPKQINEVMENLSFDVTGKQPDENITHYLLGVHYKDRPVVNCDYSYFDGRNWSPVISAKDGQGVAEITGDTAHHKDLRIKIEYAFENEWKIDNEVYDVLNKVDPVIFKKSYMNIPLVKPAKAAAVADASNAAPADAPARTAAVQTVDGSAYIALLERVEAAIRSRNYASARDCFTDEGYDMFTQLIQYGRARILSQPKYVFLKFEDGILVRSLPMRFSFRNNRRVFVEDVVFNISPGEGKIRSLSFALPADVCNDIFKYDKWGEYSRLAIINFIENYQTAYALKRLDFITSIFSDNALIIVGKVVKKYTGTDNRTAITGNDIKLTKYSKEQYLKQLSTVFKSNEYVNLKFTDVQVKKAGVGGEIYGIQLRQDYFSTNYGDTGYLFLMVDLNRTDEPVIHIRTWQQEKDPKFGVYDISNF